MTLLAISSVSIKPHELEIGYKQISKQQNLKHVSIIQSSLRPSWKHERSLIGRMLLIIIVSIIASDVIRASFSSEFYL